MPFMKVTLSASKFFRMHFNQRIMKMGFLPVPQSIGPHLEDVRWTARTDAGVYTCHTDKEDFTVYGRFDHPTRAALIADCNPYSGKWNFMHTPPGNGWADESHAVLASNHILIEIAQIMPRRLSAHKM